MDIYHVKLELIKLISEADVSLQPRDEHVSGNAVIFTGKPSPTITVNVRVDTEPIYGYNPPTIQFGELYNYNFTAYVFHNTVPESRELADKILDYLKLHNKRTIENTDTKIIDIVGLTIEESPHKHGPKARWRTEINGTVITEESLL